MSIVQRASLEPGLRAVHGRDAIHGRVRLRDECGPASYASGMSSSGNEGKDEAFEVKCPKCKRRVKVDPKKAEAAMKVTCSCGEEIRLAKMV